MTVLVPLDYLQANQTVAALQTRAEYLARHSAPGDNVTARAVADCISAEYAIRAAWHIETEAELDAAHAASTAEMDELAEADAPLANASEMYAIAESERRALWGDR